MLNGSRIYYNTIKSEKKLLPFVQLQGNAAFASLREQLYEQMTSNAAFTERNIQKANAYLLLFLSGAKIFGHVSHSTELVRMCLTCLYSDFNSADWISDNVHVISS